MQSEIFINKLIRSPYLNNRIYSAIEGKIPADYRNQRELPKTLRNLGKIATISSELGIGNDQLFQILKHAIRDHFNFKRIPSLTRQRLRDITKINVQIELQSILNCKNYEEALPKLFNTAYMFEALEDYGEDIYSSSQLAMIGREVKNLINALTEGELAEAIEETYKDNWESTVKEEEWLNPDEIDKLINSSKLGRPATQGKALAALVEYSKPPEAEKSLDQLEVEGKIGSIGLLQLRKRLDWIINRAIDEAAEKMDNASVGLHGFPIAQLMNPLFNMYELGRLGRGLEQYLNPIHSLRDLLYGCKLTKNPIDEEKITWDKEMVVDVTPIPLNPNNQDQEELGNFEIKIWEKDQPHPSVLLGASRVPMWVIDQLERDIPKLTPNDLNNKLDPGTLLKSIMDNKGEFPTNKIYDRLLNTSFPILEPEKKHLKLLLHLLSKTAAPLTEKDEKKHKDRLGKKTLEDHQAFGLGAEFIQVVTLSMSNPIPLMSDLWPKTFSSQNPYFEESANPDPYYSKGVEDIIAEFTSKYEVIRESPNLFMDEEADTEDTSTNLE